MNPNANVRTGFSAFFPVRQSIRIGFLNRVLLVRFQPRAPEDPTDLTRVVRIVTDPSDHSSPSESLEEAPAPSDSETDFSSSA